MADGTDEEGPGQYADCRPPSAERGHEHVHEVSALRRCARLPGWAGASHYYNGAVFAWLDLDRAAAAAAAAAEQLAGALLLQRLHVALRRRRRAKHLSQSVSQSVGHYHVGGRRLATRAQACGGRRRRRHRGEWRSYSRKRCLSLMDTGQARSGDLMYKMTIAMERCAGIEKQHDICLLTLSHDPTQRGPWSSVSSRFDSVHKATRRSDRTRGGGREQQRRRQSRRRRPNLGRVETCASALEGERHTRMTIRGRRTPPPLCPSSPICLHALLSLYYPVPGAIHFIVLSALMCRRT